MSTSDERGNERTEVLPRGETISEHGDGRVDCPRRGSAGVSRVLAAFHAQIARTS